jgi:CopA family copper-resistance protein
MSSRSPDSGSRRRFLHGLALGSAALGLGLWRGRVQAAPQVLSGTQFDLEIGALAVDFSGQPRTATVVNGRLPAPLLRWREGDEITLRVRNALSAPSSIHWHGILLPASMDGVPGLSFMGIAPGATYEYRFTVRQSGTYWYHSHSRFQEQTGLYGPIVIEPRGGERHRTERDYVVLLSDWTDTDAEHIYATLKKQSNYYNFGRPTLADFLRDTQARGLRDALAQRRMWNQMRMDPSDLADVSGYAYTYLMNGNTPAANWTGLFARGESIRLRVINAASMTFFDVRIPGLKLRVVAADGQDIEPVSVDEFRIAPAETYDVIVTPDDERPYTIFAQAMDRSGYACSTLAPAAGQRAAIPAPDARPLLEMRDMMGEMSGMSDMPGMKGMEGSCGATIKRPASTGVAVDMTLATPRMNLDDPGIGLRDNGRRVLTYADLRTLGPPVSPDTQREITLRLTGNMERYMWSFDGTRFSQAEPLRLRYGERVKLTLINDTMMTHPIHLHGMWSEVEAPDGAFQVRKHTVIVQPAQQLSCRVNADALGRWAYHCHLMFHMEAGMFREVVVA